MRFFKFQRPSVLLVLLVFLISSFQLNWQGSGNMSESNMTEIQTAIKNNPLTIFAGSSDHDSAAKNISTRLNSLWDPAWNVFIFQQNASYDSVLYGYAFRNHWMWINGVAIPSFPSRVLAYIIWKDYNCQRWTSYLNKTNTALPGFSASQNTTISSQHSSFSTITQDVWGSTFDFMKKVYTAMGDSKYSIVVSQEYNITIGAYFCMKDAKYRFVKPINAISGSNSGAYFLFQTR